MESKAKLLGHPIHPMLIVFPLGLLATAVAFDIVALSTGDASWFGISFWMIAAGIIGGLLAAIFGLVDWWAIPSAREQRESACGTAPEMLLSFSSSLLAGSGANRHLLNPAQERLRSHSSLSY